MDGWSVHVCRVIVPRTLLQSGCTYLSETYGVSIFMSWKLRPNSITCYYSLSSQNASGNVCTIITIYNPHKTFQNKNIILILLMKNREVMYLAHIQLVNNVKKRTTGPKVEALMSTALCQPTKI